jgi:tetraacyldisaccharide 4'-kinase
MSKYQRPYLIWLNPIFAAIVWLRTWFFQIGILKRTSIDVPVLVVGNLSTGGTGKTPMIDFIINQYKSKKNLAALSRGYGRKTKGFREVLVVDDVSLVGDEPLLIKQKHPEMPVFVCEDRVVGIKNIIAQKPETDFFVLDDAYQHLRLRADFYVLLTTYNNLYVDDALLPAGNLREPASAANRANAIVVTKCPVQLSADEKNSIKAKLNLKTGQQIFFTTIGYAALPEISNAQKVLLVTGIANPAPLVAYLHAKQINFTHLGFADHHSFSANDCENIAAQAKNVGAKQIWTTEKDITRLDVAFFKHQGIHVFSLPIQTIFLADESEFLEMIDKFLS